MRDLGPLLGELCAEVGGDVLEQRVAVELARIEFLKLRADVQPAEQRLALAVALVVHFHGAGGLHRLGHDMIKPRRQIVPVPRGDADDFGARVFLFQSVAELLKLLGGDEVGLVDDDDAGFFELLLVDVGDVGGEFFPVVESEHAARTDGIDHDRQRRDVVLLSP